MNICHKCKKEVVIEVAIGRLEECPSCTAHLHCCFNCEFYDPGAQNECREPMAAYVRDRAEGNFCSFWRFKDTKPVDLMAAQAARLGLKALFGGEGPQEDKRDPQQQLDDLFKKPSQGAATGPAKGTATVSNDPRARLEALFKKK